MSIQQLNLNQLCAVDEGRPPLSDRCPKACGWENIVPSRSILSGDGADVCCDYRCPRCAYEWSTGWNVSTIYPEWIPAIRALASR